MIEAGTGVRSSRLESAVCCKSFVGANGAAAES